MQPRTSRRAILAGLAVAPIGTMPALANVVPASDPALVAIASYDDRRAAEGAAYVDYEAATEAGDYCEAEDYWSEANGEAFDALIAALNAKPTTTAGAVALLRLAGPAVVEIGHDPEYAQTLANAIGAAVDILEQGTRQ